MKIVLFFACVALPNFARVSAMEDYPHTHDTRIQRPHPKFAHMPLMEIFLQKVVNGNPVNWHMVRGELHHDKRVLSCDSPYGYAAVGLNNGIRFYACLKPDLPHDDTKSKGHNDGARESYRCFITSSEYGNMEADLLPDNKRHIQNPVGHVHYKEQDKINVNGDLYFSGRLFWELDPNEFIY